MITLHPNNNIKEYIIPDHEWTIIKDYLKYLNKMEIIPVLTDNNIKDLEIFDKYSFSSKKVKELTDMIYSSLANKRIEEYRYIYNNYEDLRFPVTFPEDTIYNFFDFLVISNGFYISLNEFKPPL